MRLLILYASRYGQTRKIAERVATVARTAGAEVHLWEVTALPPGAPLPQADAIVIAGAVYWDTYTKQLRRFLTLHAEQLRAVPTTFISVSNAARTEKGLEAAREYPAKLEKLGFRPQEVVHVAGGEPYSKYGFITRWLMIRVAKKYGRLVDPKRDYDHTDWAAVDAFAAGLVPADAEARPA